MPDFNVEITLRTQTCGRDHTYAVPLSAVYHSTCPLCAWERKNAANEREEHLVRRVAALKGVLSRMKGKRK